METDLRNNKIQRAAALLINTNCAELYIFGMEQDQDQTLIHGIHMRFTLSTGPLTEAIIKIRRQIMPYIILLL